MDKITRVLNKNKQKYTEVIVCILILTALIKMLNIENVLIQSTKMIFKKSFLHTVRHKYKNTAYESNTYHNKSIHIATIICGLR